MAASIGLFTGFCKQAAAPSVNGVQPAGLKCGKTSIHHEIMPPMAERPRNARKQNGKSSFVPDVIVAASREADRLRCDHCPFHAAGAFVGAHQRLGLRSMFAVIFCSRQTIREKDVSLPVSASETAD